MRSCCLLLNACALHFSSVMLAMVAGLRPLTSLSMSTVLPIWQRGHLHLHAPKSVAHISDKFLVAPRFFRAVSGNCQRSLIGSYGIWCPGCGVSVWGTTGRFERGVFSGDGELVAGSGRGRVRVWKNVGVGVDWDVNVPLLDQYLMREMVPVLALAVGICATLGMSLGALAGLIREVAVSGMFTGSMCWICILRYIRQRLEFRLWILSICCILFMQAFHFEWPVLQPCYNCPTLQPSLCLRLAWQRRSLAWGVFR